jgi:hypothetical protein
VRRDSLPGALLSRRRELELHRPFCSRIAIASSRLILPDRMTWFRHITIGILQILPADARCGPWRALSLSSAAALCAHRILGIDHGRTTPSDSYPSLRYPKTASTTTTTPMM